MSRSGGAAVEDAQQIARCDQAAGGQRVVGDVRSSRGKRGRSDVRSGL